MAMSPSAASGRRKAPALDAREVIEGEIAKTGQAISTAQQLLLEERHAAMEERVAASVRLQAAREEVCTLCSVAPARPPAVPLM